MRLITLTFKSGLEIYGTNEFFIQMKTRPEYYELKIFKDKTLMEQPHKMEEWFESKRKEFDALPED